jgi:hypothetical protein
MSWWNRFRHKASEPLPGTLLQSLRLDMQGWREQGGREDGMRVWRDSQTDVLSLVIMTDRLPDLADETAVREWSRSFAEEQGAGLIEAGVDSGILRLIFKRLEKPAYIFVGQAIMNRQEGCLLWTAVATERGVTGVREAAITAEMLTAGTLTPENYISSWAQDPYDRNYRGVDGSVLRFLSDDECYDQRFPDHPLSRVRRILSILPNSVQVTSAPSGT